MHSLLFQQNTDLFFAKKGCSRTESLSEHPTPDGHCAVLTVRQCMRRAHAAQGESVKKEKQRPSVVNGPQPLFPVPRALLGVAEEEAEELETQE